MNDLKYRVFFMFGYVLLVVIFSYPYVRRSRCQPCVNITELEEYCTSGQGSVKEESYNQCMVNLMHACNNECVNVVNNTFGLDEIMYYANKSEGGGIWGLMK